jgi:flagellum-specific ATP synthase
VMPDIVDQEHQKAARAITRLIAIYRDIEDLVNIGAYSPGANPEFDLAVKMRDPINDFLQQSMDQGVSVSEAAEGLLGLVGQMSSTMQNGNDGGGMNSAMPGVNQAGPVGTAASV